MKSIGLWICCFFLCCPAIQADDDVWNQTVRLPKVKETTYELLNRISDMTGLLFIYDSHLVDNDRKVRIVAGTYRLREAICTVAGDDHLQMRLIGNHILLYKPSPVDQNMETNTNDRLVVTGVVRDKTNREYLPYASISLGETGIGTVANSEGKFQLKVPDSLQSSSIRIAYMGYESGTAPVSLLTESPGSTDIYLNMKVVPIPEIIVHLINPRKVVTEMLDKRPLNYSDKPVYLTTFYREGIARKKGFVNLTEAVFKVYKRPFHSTSSDQVKLLKMRKISNEAETDSIALRMKAGIDASLWLDLVKNLADFLILDAGNSYDYTKIDMTTIDSRLAHVIAFEQKQEIKEPLLKGELYIDSGNAALLSARFEFNPEYIRKARDLFVVKQSRNLDIRPKSATYTVTYKEWNGKHYLSYIRGDLQFNVKRKKHFLQKASVIHSYFEMVTCVTDTLDVQPFPKDERIPTQKIFSDTHFLYDPYFWGDFNVILPEENLSEAFKKIVAKIEENSE